jgi:cytoskeletal protein CcmA (bactofilin family)
MKYNFTVLDAGRHQGKTIAQSLRVDFKLCFSIAINVDGKVEK